MPDVNLGIVGFCLRHRLIDILVALTVPVAEPQQQLKQEGGDQGGGEPDRAGPRTAIRRG